MKLDETLTRFLNEIQDEVSKEFGVTMSIEQIHSIVETQEEATKLGISKGIAVHWIRFGKFIFTDKVKRVKEIRSINQALAENEDVLPHERIAITKQLIIKKAEQKKASITQATLRESRPMDVETIMNTDNMYKVKPLMFVSLNNKHSKT